MEAHTGPHGSVNPEPGQPCMFGGHLDPVRLPWKWATERLTRARNYWIATTRPNGQPHSRPVWGVWLDDTFYFSTGSLAAQNLAANPRDHGPLGEWERSRDHRGSCRTDH